MRLELGSLIAAMDDYLDSDMNPEYQEQPLAQDWARVAKAAEEVGEAIDALIGFTGQNRRKGKYGTREEMLDELADVALTGLYGIQHFLKDERETLDLLMSRAHLHAERVGL